MATLNGGHEAMAKVRTLWAGWVGGNDREGEDRGGDGDAGKEEWVVSGGFDRRVVLWRVNLEDST